MNKRLFEDLNQDQKNLFNRIDSFLISDPSYNLTGEGWREF